MGRTTSQAEASAKRLGANLLDSAVTLWGLCAKHTSRAARKLRPKPVSSAQTKELLTKLSNKASRLRNKKKGKTGKEESEGEYSVWQRSILMGGKCQPLDFSGVICYDSNGKQLKEFYVRSSPGSPSSDYFCNSVAMREKVF